MNLFEQMATASRDVARTQRMYRVSLTLGNLVEPVMVWAVNPSDAICQALQGRELNGNELRISARLAG